jgi:hypothetical protein
LNALVWDGLGAATVDPGVADAAHASLHHWRAGGGPLEEARGEWLVSRVYAVLGRAEPAEHHARRSFEICEREGFGGFDLAYAYEGLARAAAVGGAPFEELRAKAASLGAAIPDPEDRTIFEDDLAAPPW